MTHQPPLVKRVTFCWHLSPFPPRHLPRPSSMYLLNIPSPIPCIEEAVPFPLGLWRAFDQQQLEALMASEPISHTSCCSRVPSLLWVCRTGHCWLILYLSPIPFVPPPPKRALPAAAAGAVHCGAKHVAAAPATGRARWGVPRCWPNQLLLLLLLLQTVLAYPRS